MMHRLLHRPLFAALLLASPLNVHAQSPTVDEASVRVSFPSGHFDVELPVRSATAAPVTLKTELLDDKNRVLSHATSSCALQPGLTHCHLALPGISWESGAGENLPLIRLHYTVQTGANSSGILSLLHIAPSLYELHIVGPGEIHPAGAYTGQLRAVNPLTGEPRSGIHLTAALEANIGHLDKDGDEDDADRKLDSQHLTTSAQGYATVLFTAPSDPQLTSVHLNVTSMIAGAEVSTSQTFRVPGQALLQLTTDKPLYQPGQSVHARILLLDRTGHALARKPATLDISDPDSTLVFRVKATTSRFGIASFDWPISARSRLGSYSLEVEASGQSARQSVRISRYDLPTFIVEPKPDQPFYLPGVNAVVDVRANYLFGKPVLHGHVRVVREDQRNWNYKTQKYDVKEGKSVEGELDSKGSFLAHVDLSLDPEPGDNEDSNAFHDLHFAAYVTDASTGRTEPRRFDVRVSAHALHIHLFGVGSQAKGLPVRLYASVTTADGLPAESDLDVALLPRKASDETIKQRDSRSVPLLRHVHTNSLGLAELDLPAYEALKKQSTSITSAAKIAVPFDDGPQLHLTARDRNNHTGSTVESFPEPSSAFRITARKSLYAPGDPIDLTIVSASLTDPHQAITLQILRSTQRGPLLLDTREIKLSNGRTTERFLTDDRYSGYIFARVFALLPRPAESTRYSYEYRYDGYRASPPTIAVTSQAMLFPRDNALHVDLKLSRDVYRPGDDATASLTVTGPQDADGDLRDPAPAALGLVAVDQAVTERTRSDNDFGGSPSFFFQEYARYYTGDVAGITLPMLEQPRLAKLLPSHPSAVELDMAATMLLSSLTLETSIENSGESPDAAHAFAYVLNSELSPTRKALETYLKTHLEAPSTRDALQSLLKPEHVDFAALRDPWDRPFHLAVSDSSYGQRALELHSDGPDKLPNTADDFNVNIATWQWFAVHQHDLSKAAEAYHQRTHAYIRDLATLRDEMHREGIDLDSWRDPWNQPFTYTFTVEQSRYVIQVSATGDPAEHARYSFAPYIVSSVRMDYFAEAHMQLESALNLYAATHPTPTTREAFDTALADAHLSLSAFPDAWGNTPYPVFHAHTFYTDSPHTESRAQPGGKAAVHTTLTPVTALSDIVTLRSAGPDGKRGTDDDFDLGTFSHLRSQQSAKQQTAKTVPHQPVSTDAAGTITGTIKDPSGAVIPSASITVTNSNTGSEFTAAADSNGLYQLAGLPPGSYTLRISAPGFMVFVYQDVRVLAGNNTELDASLNVGAASETVEVSASPETLNTSSASVSLLSLKSKQFDRLESFAKILPGVKAPPPPPPDAKSSSTPRLREYFPETLLWRPEVITSDDGHATVHFRVADSITNWQLSASASTVQGNTGAATAEFRAFQPFFASFDPPRILTIGDTLSLPIPLRNYTDRSLTVTGELSPAPWLTLAEPSATLTVPTQGSASPIFTFTTTAAASDAPMQFTARASDNRTGDAIAKPVTVHPDGLDSATTAAGVLSTGPNDFTLTIPADMIPGGNDATLRLYPNLAAHLRDALTAMAAYPAGCAEQIISIAWPSLLLQRYAAQLPHPDKKLQKDTQGYLEEAYQNLLAEQLSNGGFAYWPSDRYADPALTAYAIQFLQQASAFITIDDRVIQKAVAFLATQQQPQGKPNAGLWLTYDRGRQPKPDARVANSMLTATISSMLAGAPNTESLIRKALAALEPFANEFDEPETLAHYALAAIAVKDTARSNPAIARLRTLALSENGGAYWKLETNTPFFGWGRAGRIESTSAALRALLASGATAHDDLVARGLLFLDHEQDRHSLWYSTQATARVLDVLSAIALTTKAPAPHATAKPLMLSIDGRPGPSIPLPSADSDTGPIYVPLGTALTPGAHHVTLTLPERASAATAQLVANFYRRWPSAPPTSTTINNEQLRLAVSFSTTNPSPGNPIDATVHIEKLGFRGYGMMIAEVGLPPGADVDRASLESAMAASNYQLNHYEILPDRILVYLWPNAGGFELRFRFSLRYAIDALTAPSVVYDYYNPDARFDLPPTHFITNP